MCIKKNRILLVFMLAGRPWRNRTPRPTYATAYFATHLIESGTDLPTLQLLMHQKLQDRPYTYISPPVICQEVGLAESLATATTYFGPVLALHRGRILLSAH